MAAFITFLIFYSLGITVWAGWRVKALKNELSHAEMMLRALAQGHDR